MFFCVLVYFLHRWSRATCSAIGASRLQPFSASSPVWFVATDWSGSAVACLTTFDITNLWTLLQTRALSEAPVATMFWKYNTLAVSHIDTLLDKQTVTLAEILEQEDIIQECKSQNKKLVDFLTKQEILAELLDLILQEPSEELEERLRFKLPNIASEVITCDVPQVCQTFPSLAILNPI